MKSKIRKAPQSLQKFTELIPIEALQTMIQENKGAELELLKETLIDKINDSLKLICLPDLEHEEKLKYTSQYEAEVKRLDMIMDATTNEKNVGRFERLRRITFDINRRIILVEITKIIQSHGRIPNQTELSTSTGLSRTTIIKHLNELKTIQEYDELRYTSSILLPTVIAKLYSLGMKGDIKALKAFLDFHRGPNTTFIKNQQNNLNFPKVGVEAEEEKYI